MKRLLLILAFMPSLAFAKWPSEDDSAGEPRVPGPLSVVYRDEIVIDAGTDKIWDVMTDLPAYEQWNPWVTQAEGDMVKGGIVWVDVKLGLITMRAKHVVLTVEPESRLCWRDAGWNANFVYGQRCRTLTVQPDGTVLYQVELLVDGILSGTSQIFQGKDLKAGLAAETLAIKERAENP